jgi:hypothetical protein
MGSFEITHMEPGICSKLDSLLYWQSLVGRSIILHIWVIIQYRWPNKSPTSLWHDSNVQLVKVCASAFLHVIKVEVHGQYTDSLLSKSKRTQTMRQKATPQKIIM